uniref:E3 ubiquitin-protein ligase n=1 Tax=Aegilops tauschii subsp. strangulata TaxID=200361 RepID=A0A453DYW2_AEGTS
MKVYATPRDSMGCQVVRPKAVGIFLFFFRATLYPLLMHVCTFWMQDHEMHRGKPLYLSQERYAALTYLVASHSLDRTSEVLRQTTISFYTSD